MPKQTKAVCSCKIRISLSDNLHSINFYNKVFQRSTYFYVPVTATTTLFYGRRAFSVDGPILWNSLPNNIRETESLSTFKKQIKAFLFKRSF